MVDPKGRVTFLKRDLINFLSATIKQQWITRSLRVMSLEEMASRFDEMYDSTGRTIYAVMETEIMDHFFNKVIIPECNKRLTSQKIQ
jgi:hypothetical protein